MLGSFSCKKARITGYNAISLRRRGFELAHLLSEDFLRGGAFVPNRRRPVGSTQEAVPACLFDFWMHIGRMGEITP